MACNSCCCVKKLDTLTDAVRRYHNQYSSFYNLRVLAWNTNYSYLHTLEDEIKDLKKKKCKCKCGCK